MGFRSWLLRTALGDGQMGLHNLAREWTKQMWRAELWRGNKWLGVEIWQWPTDLVIMQELIAEQRPKVIVETGTARGGSSIFYASLLSLLDGGRVLSVDLAKDDDVHQTVRSHPLGKMVTLITGDSKSPEIIARVREEIGSEKRVLVTLDSDHTYAHVLGELRAYREFVPAGGYLVAMDTICETLGELPKLDYLKQNNPARAVREFVAEFPEFEVDSRRDKFLVGFCPGGFLRRAR